MLFSRLNMSITRRAFLKILASVGAGQLIGFNIPALSKTREPYVLETDVVNYVGPCNDTGFIGGQSIKSIGAWDGIGYPVVTYAHGWRTPRETESYYDFELANFNREIPDKFWWNPENEKYPNVHTYLIEKRFGVSTIEAIKKLNFVSSDKFIKHAIAHS